MRCKKRFIVMKTICTTNTQKLVFKFCFHQKSSFLRQICHNLKNGPAYCTTFILHWKVWENGPPYCTVPILHWEVLGKRPSLLYGSHLTLGRIGKTAHPTVQHSSCIGKYWENCPPYCTVLIWHWEVLENITLFHCNVQANLLWIVKVILSAEKCSLIQL